MLPAPAIVVVRCLRTHMTRCPPHIVPVPSSPVTPSTGPSPLAMPRSLGPALTLDLNVLGSVMSGEDVRWNDPRILASNPGLAATLSARATQVPVVVVVPSGDTLLHQQVQEALARLSPTFATSYPTPHTGRDVWPNTTRFVRVSHEQHVELMVQRLEGAIGFVGAARHQGFAPAMQLLWGACVQATPRRALATACGTTDELRDSLESLACGVSTVTHS
jgi:hypothetical protein